ncbi:uncharacterized protein CLUP02_10422 [Colletotrichum lupini]|uniref:Uncharacterized protein n=1 Tax=Colletotrichum lupini TaxID=145971 RepID=A0A9Q8SY99_9PEZI|nr:uncharacterized protein CLUP02_10422 [Colletotrichum lupini]UQC84926.1 hypothetical protein CLUP02_10422 [Colletotrichum lupini]
MRLRVSFDTPFCAPDPGIYTTCIRAKNTKKLGSSRLTYDNAIHHHRTNPVSIVQNPNKALLSLHPFKDIDTMDARRLLSVPRPCLLFRYPLVSIALSVTATR